jgi:MFS family permease
MTCQVIAPVHRHGRMPGMQPSSTVPLGARPTAALPVVWVMLGTFIVTFDFFAINVTVPTLRDALAADAAQLQWVVAAFGLLYGAGLIAGARLGERHGAERVFGLGLALFALTSAAAAAAPDLWWLIGARAAQGVAAALLSPQVLSLAGRLPDPAQRQRAFVAYGAALGFGAALGPLLGSALVEANLFGLGWRAVFLPQVLLASAAALRAQPWRPADGRGPALDLASVALLVLSTMALLVPLIEGRRLQWPLWLLALPVIAALGLVMFWRRQRNLAWHHSAALVDPALMQRPFVGALITVLVFYCSNASCILIVSLWLRSVYELRPITAAAVYTAMSVGFIATTFGGRRWFGRWGDRALVFGAAALAAGQLAIALQLHLGVALWALLPALLFAGAAFGVVMSPLVARAVGTLPLAQAGMGGGVVVTVQWIGNALGVATLGSVYFALAPRAGVEAAALSHVLLAALAAAVALLLPRWIHTPPGSTPSNP